MRPIIARRGSRVKDKRICSRCGSDKTSPHTYRMRDGTIRQCAHWRRDKEKGGWVCEKCYSKHIMHPKHAAIHHKIYNPRRFLFKQHRVLAKEDPRIGVCNWCRAIKGQMNAQYNRLCKRTSMAHLTYHDDDPLKDTLEACLICHNKYDKGIAKEKR